ncbi:ACP S-malonyltransferase [Shouchella hunanensis]|uniref:[acyl-carrier-protein] S-malonyltransferase n=1 Tax=Shouchella hunanensis TaxID=766894 RepID=A0ABY7VZA0_9BACI|nr:ACP S-malonyltransferase [Shouchella hunanensis]WDF02032.1 ACP S-malonyltransferase [Shouchella hunanensis]
MTNLAVVFPGQASQYVGMGKELYHDNIMVQELFTEASEILGYDLADLCFNGPSQKLNLTEYTQPAVLTMSVAMYQLLKDKKGFSPSYLAGHSIGEISALTASGVLSFKDAIHIAKARGEAMAACDPDQVTGMSAVTKLDVDMVDKSISSLENVQIANINSPLQTVISGKKDSLRKAEEILISLGAKIIPLNVSGAFHSQFMTTALEPLAIAMENVHFNEFQIPVVRGDTGQLYKDKNEVKDILLNQLIKPVYWTKVCGKLSELNVTHLIESGPKDVLKNLALNSINNFEALSYDFEEDHKSILTILESLYLKPNLIGLCLGAAVSTKNTNWDEEEYKNGVIAPYKEIEKYYLNINKENRQPTKDEMKACLVLLRKIFNTKNVPISEQEIRLHSILTKNNQENLLTEFSLEVISG